MNGSHYQTSGTAWLLYFDVMSTEAYVEQVMTSLSPFIVCPVSFRTRTSDGQCLFWSCGLVLLAFVDESILVHHCLLLPCEM